MGAQATHSLGIGFRGVWARSRKRRPDARILPVLIPVTAVGLATLVAAVIALVGSGVTALSVGGLVVLVIGATLAEGFPVPIELEGMAAGGVSLAAVFI